MKESLKTIYQAILVGDIGNTQKSVQIAMNDKIAANEILNTALIPAMDEVGRLFEE